MYLVYDYHRVPLERDESTTCSITLPPELYDTSEQAAPGAWMLLEANFAINRFNTPLLQIRLHAPSAGQTGYYTPQCSPYRHCCALMYLSVGLFRAHYCSYY